MKNIRLDVPVSRASLVHLRTLLQRALEPRILKLRAQRTRVARR